MQRPRDRGRKHGPLGKFAKWWWQRLVYDETESHIDPDRPALLGFILKAKEIIQPISFQKGHFEFLPYATHYARPMKTVNMNQMCPRPDHDQQSCQVSLREVWALPCRPLGLAQSTARSSPLVMDSEDKPERPAYHVHWKSAQSTCHVQLQDLIKEIQV